MNNISSLLVATLIPEKVGKSLRYLCAEFVGDVKIDLFPSSGAEFWGGSTHRMPPMSLLAVVYLPGVFAMILFCVAEESVKNGKNRTNGFQLKYQKSCDDRREPRATP
jgi:hypothetical protein